MAIEYSTNKGWEIRDIFVHKEIFSLSSEICVCLLTVRVQREFFFDYVTNICVRCGNRQSFYIVCSRIVPDMMMPLQEARLGQTTKRKRVTSTEVAPTPDPPPQSPKGQKKLRYLFSRPTPKFWDHLSRVLLSKNSTGEQFNLFLPEAEL